MNIDHGSRSREKTAGYDLLPRSKDLILTTIAPDMLQFGEMKLSCSSEERSGSVHKYTYLMLLARNNADYEGYEHRDAARREGKELPLLN